MLIFCEHAAWTLRPFGYHLVSLALHGMIGVALFVVTKMLLEVAAGTGAGQRQEPLVVFAAGLATLLCSPSPEDRGRGLPFSPLPTQCALHDPRRRSLPQGI